MAVTVNSASFFSQENESITLAWARNIVFLNLQAASNWSSNNVYYLELELGVDSVGSLVGFPIYSKILIEEPNKNGQIIFELQQAMQDYSLINIAVPDFNTNLIQQHEAPTFYIKIWEVSDAGKVLQELPRMQGATGNRKYLVDAIDAALDRESFTYQQQFDWIFGDANEGGRKFLTSVEDPKSTTKKANEFLYWFGSQPNRDLSVYCKIYYDDGTEETVTLFEYMAGYHIQCIPTRYDFIKSKSTQPTKNIIVWGVYVGYNNFRISEFFRYELHEQQNREAKYFLAKNSLGVFDTLICAGDYEDFLEAESETASKRDFANYAITDAQKFIVSKTGKRGGTANTAFLTRLQSVVKQDFTLSREMLLQSDKGFIPIIAEKIKQVYSIKNNNLIGYSFEYTHAHNVTHYTNKIFRPILGEVPTPPELPKFNIKNTGISGYVRVEYDSIVLDVAPNSEENIQIFAGTSVKVTWGVVNFTTGLLDASRINIAYPDYAFPARIDTAIFDSVVQTGTAVAGIADENTVKKARSFTFTMPNNDYFAEVKFKEISIIDVDFENPICVNNIANNSTIVTIRDRKNLVSFTQATPSARALYFNNKAIWTGTANSYMQLDLTFRKEHLFLAGSVDVFEPNSRGANAGQINAGGYLIGGLGITSPHFGVEGFGIVGSSTYIRRGSEDNKFGVYTSNGGSGKPIPDFSYDNSYLSSPFVFNMSNGKTPKLFVKGSSYNYPNSMFLGFTDSPGSYPFHLGSEPQTVGKESVFRSIITEALTSNEIDVLNLKLKTKYGA